MLRVGLAVRPGMISRGGHPTGNCGVFGAASVASKLLGPDTLTTAYALGSADTNIVGLSEIPADGRGHLKRTFGGAAVAAGIRATELAAGGLTGPLTNLDTDASWGSFARAFDVDDEHAGELTAGLGSTWHILDVHYKIYAQDGFIQPMTEALRQIKQDATFDVSEIEEVRIGTNRHAHDRVIGTIREPRDLTDAQFVSGAEHSARVASLRRLTAAEVDEKFAVLAEEVLPSGRGAAVRDTVRELEKIRDVSTLMPLLVADGRTR
jgi:2-methylcitrate dehydratase PrpD